MHVQYTHLFLHSHMNTGALVVWVFWDACSLPPTSNEPEHTQVQRSCLLLWEMQQMLCSRVCVCVQWAALSEGSIRHALLKPSRICFVRSEFDSPLQCVCFCLTLTWNAENTHNCLSWQWSTLWTALDSWIYAAAPQSVRVYIDQRIRRFILHKKTELILGIKVFVMQHDIY